MASFYPNGYVFAAVNADPKRAIAVGDEIKVVDRNGDLHCLSTLGGEFWATRDTAAHLGADLNAWFDLGAQNVRQSYDAWAAKVDAICARIDAILTKEDYL